MTTIQVRNRCSDFDTYRAARVKSLFNAESGCNFAIDAKLDIDDGEWSLGLIVGPSGSGKTSIGRQLFGGGLIYDPDEAGLWPGDQPIVEAINPGGSFDDVTAALGAVGLGDVPAWLRPYRVLSNGEKFRANLARLICEKPDEVVVDEFTSVVDRQIAKFGALAFGKAWKRTGKKAVLLSCHYDIIEWLEPDWVFDTSSSTFRRRSVRRPRFDLEIYETDWRFWPLFEPHHYLKLPRMPCSRCYVGVVEDQVVCHVAMSTKNLGPHRFEARFCRLVVMPEWQGAGVGLRFLAELAERNIRGENRWGKPITSMIHTSHPGLCAALRRSPGWQQISAKLYGDNKRRSLKSIKKSNNRIGKSAVAAGFGGHFRAVQGFRYYGAGRLPKGRKAARK
ncbi:MAG: ABC transporter ATP-binding protein [Sumerlaeia bacterium]